MSEDRRRTTLVSRHKQLPQRSWDLSADALSRIVLIDSFASVRPAILRPHLEAGADIERVILDCSCSESEYLALLAELPHEFRGDVVMIREGDSGFLSATGRGGDRVLYALALQDVRFYLETHHLVLSSANPKREVLKFRPRVIAGPGASGPDEHRSQESNIASEDTAAHSDERP